MTSQSDKIFTLSTAADPTYHTGNEHLEKQRSIATLAKKSFILKERLNNEDEDDLLFKREVRTILEKKEESDKLKKLASSKNIFDKNYWLYLASRNKEFLCITMLEMNALLLTYPLNSLKTRVQVKHPFEDVSHYLKNAVEKQSLYQGISQSMYGSFLGGLLSINTYRYMHLNYFNIPYNELTPTKVFSNNLISHLCGDILSFPIRHLFDTRKQYFQLGEMKTSLKQVLKSWYKGFAPAMCRDLSFRIVFNFINQACLYAPYYSAVWRGYDDQFDLINYESRISFEKRVRALLLGTFIAALISNPFDVVATKIMTQQYDKYHGMIHAFKTIRNEEKLLKLCASGLSTRFGYFGVNGFIVMTLYPPFRQMAEEAYSF